MWKKYRTMACMGIVGAVLFGVGDWLIYLYPGLALQNDIQPLWAEMPAWRFVGSAWCGIIGGMIMMYGAYSAYVAISNELGHKIGKISSLGIAGAVMAGFVHFALGTLLPLTYKSALAEGASVEQAARMCMRSIRIAAISSSRNRCSGCSSRHLSSTGSSRSFSGRRGDMSRNAGKAGSISTGISVK